MLLYSVSGAAARRAATIAAPGAVAGELTGSDSKLEDGSVGDDYSITLRRGQVVTIFVRGGEATGGATGILDTYAVIYNGTTEVVNDDDSGGGPSNTDAKIVFTAPSAGTFTLRVSTSGQGLKTGKYLVQVFDGSH
jgi:hypothetical protein